MRKFRRVVLMSVVVATIALAGMNAASAEPVASGPSFTAVPDVIAGLTHPWFISQSESGVTPIVGGQSR